MNKQNEKIRVFAPGEYILDELKERNWRQVDLAFIMGQPESVVSQIVKGKRPVSLEIAQALAHAFDQPVDVWLNLQRAFDKGTMSVDDDAVAKRAKWLKEYPIREMQRRGWIADTKDPVALEHELCNLFEENDISNVATIPHAARKPGDHRETTPVQNAWLARAKQLAKSVVLDFKYNERKLPDLLNELAKFREATEDVRLVSRVLNKYGIRFVIVEQLPKTKIDAACFWLNKNVPVIAMTLRRNRIDNFWFNLAHELGHVKNRDSLSIDVGLFDADETLEDIKPEQERLADEFAQSFLVDQTKFKDWINRHHPFFKNLNIMAFAMMNEVHPGIIVGLLHHNKKHYGKGLEYTHGWKMLTKIREYVINSSMTDGWGHTITLT